ncbi:MAG: hypothetical protein NC180_11710 [Muribaculaceae bacterium]|nr:hypothetical protein [Roseburia sp.]MCM1430052.1 hypothetical protein [Muribaculaceae bacterium]MCM1493875.1 hypothetical protein [Muribaculaceae bacterium]
MSAKPGITTRDITLIGLMIATIEIAKRSLAFVPNVELVSFLIILYTLYFGKRIFYALPAFLLLEGVSYGFGLWWFMYLYIWPMLAGLVLLFRKQTSVWFWSILSALFGLAFGALCSIPYIFLSGPKAAFTWWVAGIPYDVIHCISNFAVCLILYLPLSKLLTKLTSKFNF